MAERGAIPIWECKNDIVGEQGMQEPRWSPKSGTAAAPLDPPPPPLYPGKGLGGPPPLPFRRSVRADTWL